jgi:putative tricarboxylic transport membrane protein
MKNLLSKDRMGGLIWLALGVGVCLMSVPLKLGRLQQPGAGFMPFFSGIVLGIFGLILTFSSHAQELTGEGEISDQKVSGKRNIGKLFLTSLALFSYILLFQPLGFFFTTFLFLFFLFKLAEPKKWVIPSVLSGAAVILGYLIFSIWLKSQLPKGIIGF